MISILCLFFHKTLLFLVTGLLALKINEIKTHKLMMGRIRIIKDDYPICSHNEIMINY